MLQKTSEAKESLRMQVVQLVQLTETVEMLSAPQLHE